MIEEQSEWKLEYFPLAGFPDWYIMHLHGENYLCARGGGAEDLYKVCSYCKRSIPEEIIVQQLLLNY